MKKKIAIPIVVSISVFAFLIISVLVYTISTTANPNEVNANGNGIRFYGCTKYEITFTVHCDPLMNKQVGYAIQGNSSRIYNSTGTPMYVAGRHGLGLELVANGREGVEFANTSKLDPNKFSISLWLKAAKIPEAYSAVISHYNRDSSAGWSLDSFSNGTSSAQLVRLSVFSAGGHRFSSSPATITTDTFAYIVATFNGSSIKLYKNGNLLGTAGFNGKYVSDPQLPLMIGSSSYCLVCNIWSGIVDDVRFYNRAINESEVKQIFFNDSYGTVSDGLVGYWPFENNLNDISGNHRDGNLDSIITSVAFAPDGRLFFDEKDTGKIRIMQDGRVLPTPFAKLSDYYVDWEQGLLGLTLDPKFEQNHFVYLYYTAIDNKGEVFNRLVRFTENNNQAINMVVLLDKIPASRGYHAGGVLAFGSDDKLYVTVGDATLHIYAQDGGIFLGKVLRINRDGTIPQDNPFPNSPIYTLGHRNLFGLAFDKKDGTGIITENGDFHYDKINLIQKGGNYGFPTLEPPNVAPELFTNNSSIKPLRSYWQTIAPTQAIYYDGDKIPQLKNKFLFGTFTGYIYALTVDNSSKQVIEEEKIVLRHYPFEPVIFIAQSPSGDIYYGGYHIDKLNSVDIKSKIQYLFPIEIKSLSNVAINDLQSSNNGTGIAINIHTPANKNGSSSSTPPYLQLIIPNGLMPEISSVTTTITNGGKQPFTKPVVFTITSSSPTYKTIGIPLRTGVDYSQLFLNGISTSKNVNNTATSNNLHLYAVSIVKYASYSSTQMPYDPSPLNIVRGTPVTWTNNDFTSHTVTGVTNKFDSGILVPGQTFEHTFDEPGIVKYYCTIHPYMSGKVIVK